jgi:hypothetical protein
VAIVDRDGGPQLPADVRDEHLAGRHTARVEFVASAVRRPRARRDET